MARQLQQPLEPLPQPLPLHLALEQLVRRRLLARDPRLRRRLPVRPVRLEHREVDEPRGRRVLDHFAVQQLGLDRKRAQRRWRARLVVGIRVRVRERRGDEWRCWFAREGLAQLGERLDLFEQVLPFEERILGAQEADRTAEGVDLRRCSARIVLGDGMTDIPVREGRTSPDCPLWGRPPPRRPGWWMVVARGCSREL